MNFGTGSMSIGKKKIVITGAGGIIGAVLRKGLKNDFNLTSLDLKADPENNIQVVDVRDFEALKTAVADHNAIIHLAWAYWGDVDHNVALKVTEQNFLMYTNVYRAAIEAKIPRVIMASSVHADNFWKYKGEPSSLLPNRVHGATGGYGANKRAVEEFGRTYAELELLEVVTA
jgi:nucleoside-diphosphate-sugar epimerase